MKTDRKLAPTTALQKCWTPYGEILIAAFLISFIPGCGGKNSDRVPASTASEAKKSRVIAQGQILPQSGFTELVAKPGDIVDVVHVSVGERVTAGQSLVTMKSQGVFDLKIATLKQRREDVARAQEVRLEQLMEQITASELQVAKLRADQKLLDDQQRLLALAKEQVTASRRVLERMQDIANNSLTSEFMSKLELERQKLLVDETDLTYQQKLFEYRQAQETVEWALRIAEQGASSAQKQLSVAEQNDALKVIDLELQSLELERSSTQISAPTDGVILKINAQAGEASVARPVLEMADDSNLVCELEVNEMDARFILEGQSVTVHSRAFAKPLQGIVAKKYAMVGRPQLKPLDPLARVDYRTISVVVALEGASQEIAKNWLQLQVEAEVLLTDQN